MAFRLDRRQFILMTSGTAGLVAAQSSRARTNDVQLRVLDLKVEYVANPLGVESASPRLSWRIEAAKRGVLQSAYRILVATSKEILAEGKGDLWDSGKVISRRSFGVRYSGRELASRMRCWWMVQVWDESDDASQFSVVSWWEMGLIKRSDWVAQWLTVEDPTTKADRGFGLQWIWGDSPGEAVSLRLRGRFRMPVETITGRLLVTAQSAKVSQIWIDGCPIGGPDDEVTPGRWRSLRPLQAGEHLVAVEVKATPSTDSNGIAQQVAVFLRIESKRGDILRFGSNREWKFSAAEDSEWYTKEYDDREWKYVTVLNDKNHQPWPATPAMYLRKEFSVRRPVITARLYATALGCYEARINGQRVGDALLTPEISQYSKRVLYRVYDVTSIVTRGGNALGLIVGDGWYGSFDGRFAWGPPPRSALAQLELLFADGSREVVATGPGWRTTESAIRSSEISVGEVYDARLDQAGWDFAKFDESRWSGAEIAERPPCQVTAQISPPIRCVQVLTPRTISQPARGVYVFDFGQIFAGRCRLRVVERKGARVELRFSELLKPSGEIDQHWLNSGDAKRDIFIAGGNPAGEAFEPHFTYRGFRFVQVTGLSVPPTLRDIEGLVVYSDLDVTGRLRMGNGIIQQLWRNTVWAQRSNFVGVPTDCPSREQRGFLADAGIFWDAAAFNMDVCAFTSRYMDSVRDDQGADGAFPIAAPEPIYNNPPFHQDGSPPAWGDGGIILPWTAWQRYGDVEVVERNWFAMCRHVGFILERNPDYIWRNGRSEDFGDWLALDQNSLDPASARMTPRDLIGTAYWAHSVDLLAQMAGALGRSAEADHFRDQFKGICEAFNRVFVHADGTVGDGSQASYILALKFGLVREGVKSAAVERLVADIRGRGTSLTTGFLGTQFALDVLTEGGFAHLVYDLLLRTEFPSWGYMFRNGATSIWENWGGEIEYNGEAVKLSQNHYALGAVCGFLFRRLAGIDVAAPGFGSIVVRPVLDARVKCGGGDYYSVMGRISTDWEQNLNGSLSLTVTIPANTTARIHIPARYLGRVEEGGKVISNRRDIHVVGHFNGDMVIDVGSGTYRFLASPFQ